MKGYGEISKQIRMPKKCVIKSYYANGVINSLSGIRYNNVRYNKI